MTHLGPVQKDIGNVCANKSVDSGRGSVEYKRGHVSVWSQSDAVLTSFTTKWIVSFSTPSSHGKLKRNNEQINQKAIKAKVMFHIMSIITAPFAHLSTTINDAIYVTCALP